MVPDEVDGEKVDLGTREGQQKLTSEINKTINEMLKNGLITAAEAAELRKQNRQVK